MYRLRINLISRALAYEWLNFPDLQMSDNMRTNRIPNGLKVSPSEYQDFSFEDSTILNDCLVHHLCRTLCRIAGRMGCPHNPDFISAPAEAPADLTTIGEPPFNRVTIQIRSRPTRQGPSPSIYRFMQDRMDCRSSTRSINKSSDIWERTAAVSVTMRPTPFTRH